MNPPKGVIDQIHKIMAIFFWRITGGAKDKHWVPWEQMCLARKEEGAGFRSLHHVANSLFAKL